MPTTHNLFLREIVQMTQKPRHPTQHPSFGLRPSEVAVLLERNFLKSFPQASLLYLRLMPKLNQFPHLGEHFWAGVGNRDSRTCCSASVRVRDSNVHNILLHSVKLVVADVLCVALSSLLSNIHARSS